MSDDQKLIVSARILAGEGHGDMTLGHVSYRRPGEDTFSIKARGIGLEELNSSTIIRARLDGSPLDPEAAIHSEIFIHSEIYSMRPDIGCVIHTHPVHCVALSCVSSHLLPISQPATLFYDDLAYFTDTICLVDDRELGMRLAQALGTHRAILMKNHGVVVVGTTVEEATVSALMLETAARIELLTYGRQVQLFPRDDILRLQAHTRKPGNFKPNFDYFTRKHL